MTGPICGGFDVIPSDAADLPQMTRGGDVRFCWRFSGGAKSGNVLTLSVLSPGVIYPIRIAKALATGTTVTGIKGII